MIQSVRLAIKKDLVHLAMRVSSMTIQLVISVVPNVKLAQVPTIAIHAMKVSIFLKTEPNANKVT